MDTAEVYAVPPSAATYGATETIIGTWFKKTGRRNDWFLATKVHGGGNSWIRNARKSDGPSIKEAVEASLRRLQTDHIDLYQIHHPWRGHYNFDRYWAFEPVKQDTATVLQVMADALGELGRQVEAGTIRFFGVSNESVWGMAKFLSLADGTALPRLATVQNEYNLIRRHFDLDHAELCHHEGVGLLAYSPLAAGVLTGKYLDGKIPAGSRGEVQKGVWRQNEYSTPATTAYIEVAKKHGLDVAQMAIAFTLTKPFLSSVIIGATNMDQLKTDIAAADLTLAPEVIADIEAVHRRYPRPI
jgi:aryl-alcohol dehydrogenase-like predicted oxidoreductase